MDAMQTGRMRLGRRRPARRMAAAAGAALSGAVLCIAAPPGAAQAAYPGGNGLIAFVRGGNIYTINPAHAAGSLLRLTRDGRASGPRWSPNGKQLAYVHRGNLWVMNADGSHKKRLTDAAPRYTDSRPTWSPNGRYLAFVRTQRRHSDGYLTRYKFATRTINTFTTTINGHLIRVAAKPAPVAWAWALTSPDSTTHGSYLAFEGAGRLCRYSHQFCLNLLGFPSQSRYSNGYPSAEAAPTKFRLTDPDWYPVNPVFGTDLMTTQENCPAGHCTPVGLDLTVLAAPQYSGGYQGVYSPSGDLVAYVRGIHGRPVIFVANAFATPARLTAGSQPDWQPVAGATSEQAKGGA
ncbi:MAG TPA: hypothetical protein VMA72_23500 [Streptosporangiaceae bacterium]|nr:hypothetical protein [Streptosporangiaceae bacterium]